MSSARLRHAIVGCGRVAPNHAAGVAASGIAEVGWACDRRLDVAEAFAAACSIPRATADCREVFADPKVSTVSIAVDHAQHAALARAALMAGKHVLVEKPLALTLVDARALAALAAERDLSLVCVAQHRFDPLFREIRRLTAEGAFGTIVSVWATLVCGREPAYYRDSDWRGTWAREGGSLFVNQAYHCVDLMGALLGRPKVLSAATAILKLADVLETEDVATASFVFPNGALGSLGCTSASPEFWRSRFDVVGTEGAVAFDIGHPPALLHVAAPNHADLRRLLAIAAETVPAPPGVGYYGLSHNRQIADFLNAIRDGRAPEVGAEEGVATLAVIAELYAAATAAGSWRSRRS